MVVWGYILQDIADSGTHSLPESLSSEDQTTEGDGESVSSSGIGSTKCDSDVFSPPVTPTDAERPTLLFQGKPPKPPAGTTCVAPVDFRMTVVPENGYPHTCSQHSTSNGAQLSSSCSNPLDSYMKGDLEEDGLNTLRELMDTSGNFSGGINMSCVLILVPRAPQTPKTWTLVPQLRSWNELLPKVLYVIVTQ